jgi:uncharacterized protein GlcG (DUF336 family)
MADFVTTHRLTHQASLKMIAAAVAKAEALGCKVNLAMVEQHLPTGCAPEENASVHMALSPTYRGGRFALR